MPRKVEGLENFKKILELPIGYEVSPVRTWANVETFFISMNELALPKL